MTPREHVIVAIRALLDDDMGPPADDVELAPIGLDSLGVVALAMDLEERLGVEVPDGEEARWTTVGDVVAWAEKAERQR